jgi:hypothetical protein
LVETIGGTQTVGLTLLAAPPRGGSPARSVVAFVNRSLSTLDYDSEVTRRMFPFLLVLHINAALQRMRVPI